MLNNITNFFNLIKTGKVKTQLDATDLLPIGTRDLRFSGQYQPTMIKYGDFISGLVGGSNGQVLFNDNDTIAGASTFYWDKVNNRVGIGTSTPTNTLDINGTARVSGNTLLDSGIIATSSGTTRLQSSLNFFSHQRLASSGAFGFDIRNSAATQCALWTYDAGSGNINFGGSTSAGALLLSTNNAERLRIFQTTGNVAINTTTDAGFTLDVNGATRVTGIGTTNATTSFQVVNSAGLVPFRILGNGNVEMPFSASLQFDFTCRGISSNGGYGTQGLRLSSQNYGNAAGTAVTIGFIGSPAGVTANGLSIGGCNLQSATYNNIVVAGDFSPSIGTNTIVGYLFNPTLNGTFSSANTIAIHTVTGNVLLGTTSGNVGIGTTSPTYKLDVNGDTKTLGLLTAYGISTNLSDMAIYNTTNNTGYIRFITQTASAQAERMRIFNTGNIGINTTTDAGFRLDVNGTARVQGTGTTSATTALRIQNSAATNRLLVRDDGSVFIGNEITGTGTDVLNQQPQRFYTLGGSQFASYIGATFNGGTGDTSLALFGVGTSGGYSGSVRFFTSNNSATPLLAMIVDRNQSVGIGLTNSSNLSVTSSAKLQVDSTTKGFLPPRMTNAERTAIVSPAVGLIVYCTDVTEGLWVYKSTGWTFIV
jgi:hypothetical protein